MKPVGLTCPHPGFEDLYAVVQLRQDNALGTLYNMVGFQTKMKYGPQAQVFRMIPGLENAEFMRLGGMHRNSFLRSPVLLSPDLSWKTQPRLRFAGQITGVEGYVESTASGLLVGLMTADHWAGRETILPPPTTALGSLLAHVTGGATASQFQPMNMNFGLMPPLPKQRIGKSERGHAYSARALEDLERWKASLTLPEVAWDAVGVFA
jgi:methylenetetrahydrofolate--tRNA-(uracil-5-)-methyltransferase